MKKEIINKKIIVNHNLDSFISNTNSRDNNNISPTEFNTKEKFNNLKNRMNNLIENLFKTLRKS